MKTYTAMLIDPNTREVTAINLQDTPAEVQNALGCEYYISLPTAMKDTYLLADWETRIIAPNTASFYFRHTSSNHSTKIVGKALVVSCNEGCLMQNLHMSTKEISSLVSWS